MNKFFEKEKGVSTDDANPKDKVGRQKLPLHLVPPAAIVYEALAMADGGAKYGPYNWRSKSVVVSIYVAACMRHLMAFWDGEGVAEDSQVPHLGHARACLGIIIDALESGALIDDRPKPGSFARLAQTLKDHSALVKFAKNPNGPSDGQ